MYLLTLLTADKNKVSHCKQLAH